MNYLLTVCIGLATYNRPHSLKECLSSILKQTQLPDEIIICDSSSTSTSEKVVNDLAKQFNQHNVRLSYIRKEKRQLQPMARNIIISSSQSEIIAFLDDDTICSKRWLEYLKKPYQDNTVGGVGGPAIDVDRSFSSKYPISSVSSNQNKVNKYGEVKNFSSRWIPPKPLNTDILSGANMSFRKKLLEKLGGFDNNYLGTAFREETDVMIRVRKIGYTLVYHPDALVYHLASSQGGCSMARNKVCYWIGRNHIYFLKKNFASWRIAFLRLMIGNQKGNLPSVIKLLSSVILKRKISSLWLLRGYLDALRIPSLHTSFLYVNHMKILVYAPHYTKIRHDKGYIGGVWIRLLEILNRANRFDLEYVLVEPSPKLGYNYESIRATDVSNYENIGDTVLIIIFSTIEGVRRALKGDINLILSPIGTLYGVIPAFLTSLLTGIPFAVIEHNVPVFQNLLEKNPKKKFSSSLGGFYRAIRYFKHKEKSLYYAIASTLFNYFTFKLMKAATILAIGTGVKYLHSLDSTLTVKELFPANSIPSSVLSSRKSEVKSYDAIYLGSLIKEKGVMDAILAWKGVVEWNSSFNLAVIGSVKGSKIRLEKIKSLLKLYGLEDNVHLLFDPMIGAPTEYVLDVMAKSRIMLFPSTLDTWSFTVGEALSLGLPVVAYDIQAFKKSYPDCKALICVPIGDIKQLSYEVRHLLENPSKLKSLSEDALRYMEKYYTWDQVIAAEKKLYKSICFCS